jgi:hypothetical protein
MIASLLERPAASFLLRRALDAGDARGGRYFQFGMIARYFAALRRRRWAAGMVWTAAACSSIVLKPVLLRRVA